MNGTLPGVVDVDKTRGACTITRSDYTDMPSRLYDYEFDIYVAMDVRLYEVIYFRFIAEFGFTFRIRPVSVSLHQGERTPNNLHT